MNSYPDPAWQPYFIVAAFGAVLILGGIVSTFVNFYVSIRDREQNRVGDDPWDARTLEWATQSPPAPYNFPESFRVNGREAFWQMKQQGFKWSGHYTPIHMPKSTAMGVLIAAAALVFGFAMVWYIWWLAILSFAGMLILGIAHTFNYNRDYYIQTDVIAATEKKGATA